MNKIWVISENKDNALEMLGKAQELIGEGSVTAYLVGDETVGKTAISYGADSVKLMNLPENTTWEQYVSVLVKEADVEKPELILVGASRRGKDLAAQLAALLDSLCITECKTIEITDGNALLSRIVYGGLAEKKVQCSFPVVATIASRTFSKPEEPDIARTGEISKLELTADIKIKVVERRAKPKELVNINESNIVVGVGRGFTDKSEIAIAEDLAQAIGGEVGCSRPIAEDLHWLPEDRYIGISGKAIKPSVYIAAGISGQVQHVYGIRDAKTIVAIDKNENAPIFQVADYYIVGDLKEALPALTRAAKEVQGN